jgi:hypothetical protein
MTDASRPPVVAARTLSALSVVTIVALIAVLVLRMREPFSGTTTAFVGRIVGPIGMIVMLVPNAGNVWNEPRRSVLLLIGAAVGILGLILAIVG